MPFDRGTLPLTFLKINGDIPKDATAMFQTKTAGKLDGVGEEPQIGWVSGRHLLERNIDENTALMGKFIYLNLRISQRKIPSALLKAECRKEELDHMLANNVQFVPRKIRAQIKKEIIEKRLMTMPPSISGTPFVIDAKSGMIYLATPSLSRIETFQNLFYDTLKTDAVLLDFANSAKMLLDQNVEKLPSVKFCQHNNQNDDLSARDFLTWLWYYSETQSAKIKLGKNTCGCLLEGPFLFSSASSENETGSIETVLRRGNPARSAEAQTALAVGKKVKKAKITIAREKEIWSAIFNTDNFTFSSLSLPPVENLDPISSFEERISFISDFHSIIMEYLKIFLSSLKSASWKEEQNKIIKWAEKRD
jgi:hypothetical protein